ncbi:MAG: LLM class flavin-dependent oxidoreductase, partial [Pseudomonadales bacterium]|nr:LLM class flavin-dependent oxidoreductase [Pseudomonadales bacterium]
MRIGISISSSYPGAAPREGAAWMVDRARAAWQAGLDSLFVGDHHVTSSPYYQNTPMIGRMLAQWGDRPVGALYLLPLWHPVLLAEQVATLACLAEGRFILQCGLGGDPRQSAGMGTRLADRVSAFEAGLDTLRRLWAGERVSMSAPWNFEAARISPLPPEPIEVWIGAQAPQALQRAARMGEGWLASPGLTLDAAARDLNRYRQSCAEFGRSPTTVAIRRDIYIGRSAQEAREVMRPYIEAGYRGFPDAALMYGSVEEVTEQMR